MEELSTYIEKELLQQLATGNEQAFETLFNAYRKKLYTNIYKLTDSREAAEDAVHEVFLKIWLNRTDVGAIENFGAYLRRMAHNQAVSSFRRMAKETLIIAELRHDVMQQANATASAQPSHQLMAKEVRDFIRDAINNLTPQQKTVYLLNREEGLKPAEIADQLGISLHTAKKHLADALQHLRRDINDNYGPYAFAIYVIFNVCLP